MSGFEWLEDLIKKEIPDAHIEVTDLTGTRDHLGILVASDVFKGKLLIDQHQILMNILQEELKQRIHAVKLQTLTKEKFEQTKG